MVEAFRTALDGVKQAKSFKVWLEWTSGCNIQSPIIINAPWDSFMSSRCVDQPTSILIFVPSVSVEVIWALDWLQIWFCVTRSRVLLYDLLRILLLYALHVRCWKLSTVFIKLRYPFLTEFQHEDWWAGPWKMTQIKSYCWLWTYSPTSHCSSEVRLMEIVSHSQRLFFETNLLQCYVHWHS